MNRRALMQLIGSKETIIPPEEVLLFQSDSPRTITTTDSQSKGVKIYYSINEKATWKLLRAGKETEASDKIYMFGISSVSSGIGIVGSMWRFSGSSSNKLEVYGDLMSLVLNEDLTKKTTINTENAFLGMFEGCTSLVKAPDLSATTLAEGCYNSMFAGCTSLVNAPELPATTLAEYCYNRMFNGCTSLVNAPELPATTLAEYCYYRMFDGCTSLVKAPDLPATTLADNCYGSMFTGCTSLVKAPDLPATTSVEYCYNRMFEGCTSLVNAPELPATTLANVCYYRMFHGCTSLATAPELPATTLAERCYYNMFRGCTSLTSITMYYTGNDTAFTDGWVEGVNTVGTLYKAGTQFTASGDDTYPSTWTQVEM